MVAAKRLYVKPLQPFGNTEENVREVRFHLLATVAVRARSSATRIEIARERWKGSGGEFEAQPRSGNKHDGDMSEIDIVAFYRPVREHFRVRNRMTESRAQRVMSEN